MNDELIFVKTASGEDAVRDRTRLVQRNLRMVLILVDGLTKVSALKQKAGDPAMIETALAELERIGLIESTEARGSRQATAVTDALSIATAHVEPSAIDAYEDFPTVDTVFEQVAPPVSSIGAETVVPAEALPPPKTTYVRPASTAGGWFSRLIDRWRQIREERAYEKAYGTPSSTQEAIAPPSRRRIGRRRIKLVPVMLVVLMLAAGFAAVRVVLYPYDEYRPDVEAQLSRMLADEVRVGHIKLVFAPFPTFILHNVVVGRNADATAEQVSIVPNPGFILGGQPVRAARINGLQVRESAIGKTTKWFLLGTMGEYQIDRIEVEDLILDLGWLQLRGLAGTLSPGLNGGASFSGRSGAGALEFEVVPGSAGLAVTARAGQWVVPVQPPLQVAALDFSGTLAPGSLVVTKVDARVFDGLVSGHGALAWDSSPRMVLDLELKHVAAAKLLEALSAPVLVNGELGGQVQYTTSTPSVRWLGPGAKAAGDIAVVRGSLKRIDLAGALRTSGQRSGPYRGGETGFEDFSGRLSVDAGAVRVVDVRLSSGLMLASGQAAVTRETGKIAGAASVEMRGSVRAARAAMSIGGNASDPELRIAR
ncbi:MAG: hypothetical protein HZC22_07145 [Rhodocyclales bacterium]|nr:hypothetical protein [Rhodocyclales bacterium]